MSEVLVGGQQHELSSHAQRSQQRIHRPELDTAPLAPILQVGCLDVVATIRDDHAQRLEAIDERIALSRTGESLEQLLQDESGRRHWVAR